jgi:hypothetical protein
MRENDISEISLGATTSCKELFGAKDASIFVVYFVESEEFVLKVLKELEGHMQSWLVLSCVSAIWG